MCRLLLCVNRNIEFLLLQCKLVFFQKFPDIVKDIISGDDELSAAL